jgi:hypothetical protein
MSKPKTPAAVISMPATPQADRARKARAALREFNKAIQAFSRTLDVLGVPRLPQRAANRLPQRATNLALVRRRVQSSRLEEV